MATQSFNLLDIVHTTVDWLDRNFGYAQTQEFAAPKIEIGDEIIISGCRWSLDNKVARCPYLSLPAEYADYTLEETWIYLWNVDKDRRFALADYVPERYLISLIEREG